MLCCAGLLLGYFVGQSLGGVWIFIAPAAGFIIGLIADRKFMHRKQGMHHPGSATQGLDSNQIHTVTHD